MPRKLGGFTLIEMAVVLMIIGLIGGMTLPALKVMLDWQKTTATADRQEKILYALANYAIQNKTLPYAADPNDVRGRQDTETRRRRGIIPFHDLGLPEAFARDGHHHWFTYVVNDYYVQKPYGKASLAPTHVNIQFNETVPQLCLESPPQKLSIKVARENVSKNVALAIISHGPQGRGAYPFPLETPAQGADELQNVQSDSAIIDRPLSKDPKNPFSHKVAWVTGPYLMAFYGRSTCPAKHYVPVTERIINSSPFFFEQTTGRPAGKPCHQRPADPADVDLNDSTAAPDPSYRPEPYPSRNPSLPARDIPPVIPGKNPDTGLNTQNYPTRPNRIVL